MLLLKNSLFTVLLPPNGEASVIEVHFADGRIWNTTSTQWFYDGTTYDDCGFEAKVRLGKELSGNASEYEVFIYVSNGNGTKLVKTDVGVVSWLTGR